MVTPPDGQRRACRCFCTHRSRATQHRPDPRRERRRRRARRLPRVRARSVRPADHVLQWLAALDAFQSAAMGEGWSDWYAMDFVVEQGFEPTRQGTATSSPTSAPATTAREGLDCPLSSPIAACPGGEDTGWAGRLHVRRHGQDLRRTRGARRRRDLGADALGPAARRVGAPTRASSSPGDGALARATPRSWTCATRSCRRTRSAWTVAQTGGHIWQVFADRGMGYFASTEDADDTTPIENFALPPDPADGDGSLTARSPTPTPAAARAASGRVRRPRPLATRPTRRALLDRGRPGRDVPAGRRLEDGLRPGRRRERRRRGRHESPLDFQVRRDWAAFDGGGRVHAFTGPDFAAFGCGPAHAIDQSTRPGWSTVTASVLPGTRSITVKLPCYVDVSAFAVDPGAVCGDPDAPPPGGTRSRSRRRRRAAPGRS